MLAVASLPFVYTVHLVANLGGFAWWWLELPTPFPAFLLLYWWFDRYAWRFPLVRRLLNIRAPTLDGGWSGTLWSSHDNGNHDVELTIAQTWTRMNIRLQGLHSKSSSKTASVLTRECPRPLLTYTYLNEPLYSAVETMHIHHGTAILEVNLEDQSLDGDYYTGRDRSTHGRMSLKRLSATPTLAETVAPA